MLSPIAAREAVHITLLARLLARVPDGLRLKGGVNLRLFFDSPRYSEDMDLDADPRHGRDPLKLLSILDEIVTDKPYKRFLERLGITDVVPNAQQEGAGKSGVKFKFQIHNAATRLDTKVEVSFRGTSPARWAPTSTVPAARLQPYGVPPFHVHRYEHAAAAAQKVNALATRSQTQARDIFDLFLLLDQVRFPGTVTPALRRIRAVHTNARLAEAYDRCLRATDDQFRDQVGAYLLEDDRTELEPRWDEMRLGVAEALDLARSVNPEDNDEDPE